MTRRDMIRNYWGIASVMAVGFFTTVSVFAEDVNFRAANPVLRALVDTVIAADDTVDFAYPRFDEGYSDLNAEKLKYDAQGSLKNTPWLDGGRADIVATSTYRTDRTEGHIGIVSTMGTTVRTDVLALIRYSATIALKVKHPATEPKFDVRIEAHLKRLAVAQSLEEVKVLLLSGQKLAKEIMLDELLKAQTRLDCLMTGPCQIPGEEGQRQIAYQKRKVEDFKRAVPAFDDLQIQLKREGAGGTLLVSTPNANQFLERQSRAIQPGRISAVLTEEAVTATLDAYVPLSTRDLNELKSDLHSHLVGVQNGNPDSKDYLQRRFRDALIVFKKTIRGEGF